jgi:hypothetical protein
LKSADKDGKVVNRYRPAEGHRSMSNSTTAVRIGPERLLAIAQLAHEDSGGPLNHPAASI